MGENCSIGFFSVLASKILPWACLGYPQRLCKLYSKNKLNSKIMVFTFVDTSDHYQPPSIGIFKGTQSHMACPGIQGPYDACFVCDNFEFPPRVSGK